MSKFFFFLSLFLRVGTCLNMENRRWKKLLLVEERGLVLDADVFLEILDDLGKGGVDKGKVGVRNVGHWNWIWNWNWKK